MCKVQSVIKSVETSLNILAKAHRNHTENCCPEFRRSDYNDRLEAMTALTGVFPVYGSPMAICNEVAQELKEALYAYNKRMTSSIRTGILHILSYTSPDNWANNSIEKSTFDDLKDYIKVANDNWETVIQNEMHEPEAYAKFELIKKSSPKMSNLITSILKWVGRDPQNDAVVKKFNARQAKAMNGYDMVISVEPHRISGMSAFGQFTSCQDWLRKGKGHDYHNYTHRAWANLLDETCGIAYIRKTEDDEPSEQQTKVEDMQARSLVRAIELPNGQIVVYLHRIYAVSPFNQVMRETFNQWAKTLPENVHVIKMYDHSPSDYYRGTNKHGLEFDGFTRYTHKQEECTVTAGNDSQCDACEGEGHRECHVCDGSGTVCVTLSGYDSEDNYYEDEQEFDCRHCDGEGNVECHNCDGDGHFEGDEESYEPYNDHCDWIDFNYKGVRFEVPNYIMNWDVQPEHTVPLPPNWGKVVADAEATAYTDFKVGEKVKLRADVDVRRYHAIPFDGSMRVDNTDSSMTPSVRLENGYWYNHEDLQIADNVITQLPANQKLKVGDKVRILPNLACRTGYRMFSNYETDSVVGGMSIRAGQIATITSVDHKYRIDLDEGTYNWVDDMFQLEKIVNTVEVI